MNPELLKAIDPYVRKVGLYTSYTLSEKERVGVIAGTTIRELNRIGYEFPPTFMGVSLEAAKQHPETGDVHQISLRKVDPQDHQKQYHVHLWDVFSIAPTPVFVHREYRPDFQILDGESLRDAKDRLQTHYRPEWGTSEYQQGKMCEKLEELVTSES